MNPNFISIDVCVVYDRPIKTENIWVYTQTSVRKFLLLYFTIWNIFTPLSTII